MSDYFKRFIRALEKAARDDDNRMAASIRPFVR